MGNYPNNLKYSKEHEWIKIEGTIATVGITEYAAEQLGDVVHAELPDLEAEFGKDDAIGVVESVKSVSDVFSPISLKITEVNESLLDNPGIINHDPYGEGWIIKGEIMTPADVETLLSADAYNRFLSEEA